MYQGAVVPNIVWGNGCGGPSRNRRPDFSFASRIPRNRVANQDPGRFFCAVVAGRQMLPQRNRLVPIWPPTPIASDSHLSCLLTTSYCDSGGEQMALARRVR